MRLTYLLLTGLLAIPIPASCTLGRSGVHGGEENARRLNHAILEVNMRKACSYNVNYGAFPDRLERLWVRDSHKLVNDVFENPLHYERILNNTGAHVTLCSLGADASLGGFFSASDSCVCFSLHDCTREPRPLPPLVRRCTWDSSAHDD
ncbi:MAG: hypothetical protein H6739_40805 [Alphaproteobacteria bacterium]|nr:hypothetical protein [Alphaproteobacteria bacterium]